MAAQAQLLSNTGPVGQAVLFVVCAVVGYWLVLLVAGGHFGIGLCRRGDRARWGGFLAYARHAADGEWISLQGASLVVERESAGRRERAEFARQWARVEPKSGDHSLIELSGQGRSIEVGRFVRPELRQVLAREIRRALRTA